jgi:Zn-dependent protease/CBS domain-containing protein
VLRTTLPLFRVRGIQVGVHVSWLAVFALVTWSVAMGFLPEAIPGIAPIEAWLLGGVSAILLFASVLLHELAHSFVAVQRGVPVHSITLFLFGGVSNLSAESKEPRTEFLIAVVGPLTSLAIAAGAFLLALLPLDPRLGAVVGYLIVVNVLLGLFNLIPGFPLDGGRVFRAIVWKATGNVRRATQIAASLGQLVGFAFLAWGILRVFDGDLLGGLWTGAIGLFLQNAAGSSVQQLALEQRLGALRVRDAFRPDPAAANSDMSLNQLIEDHVLRGKRRAVLVVDAGRLVGIVTVGDLQKVEPERRRSATAAEIMTPADRLITITPGASLQQAAELLAQHDFDQLPVVDDGQPVGVITRADIMREFQIREALDITQRAEASPPAAAGERHTAEV